MKHLKEAVNFRDASLVGNNIVSDINKWRFKSLQHKTFYQNQKDIYITHGDSLHKVLFPTVC